MDASKEEWVNSENYPGATHSLLFLGASIYLIKIYTVYFHIQLILYYNFELSVS